MIEIEVIKLLKKLGFVEKSNGWFRDFTKVVISDDQVFIGHDIPNNKMTLIENPIENLKGYVEYFGRI